MISFMKNLQVLLAKFGKLLRVLHLKTEDNILLVTGGILLLSGCVYFTDRFFDYRLDQWASALLDFSVVFVAAFNIRVHIKRRKLNKERLTKTDALGPTHIDHDYLSDDMVIVDQNHHLDMQPYRGS